MLNVTLAICSLLTNFILNILSLLPQAHRIIDTYSYLYFNWLDKTHSQIENLPEIQGSSSLTSVVLIWLIIWEHLEVASASYSAVAIPHNTGVQFPFDRWLSTIFNQFCNTTSWERWPKAKGLFFNSCDPIGENIFNRIVAKQEHSEHYKFEIQKLGNEKYKRK